MRAALLALVLAACSSTTHTSSNCADISGNWSVDLTWMSGTCTDSKLMGTQTSSVAIQQSGGSWTILVPGIAGGCPGSLDAATCHFTASCMGSTDAGVVAISDDIDWTFNGASFSGSEIARVVPPVEPISCTANYSETGTKQ